jgi:hypothetical protein
MNMNHETFQQADPLQPSEKKSPKVSKTVWYIGCGCLALIALCVVIALGIFGWMYFFGSKDPIAAVVPNSSLVYMKVDFLQSQSEKFNEIVPIFQGIADVEKRPFADALDEAMRDELNLSFKEEIAPWMGQYGGLAITEGDVASGDVKAMFIMETRNKKRTDDFLPKFISALENARDIKFEKKEVDGVTLYVYQSEYQPRNDMIVARSGSLVYLSNSEDAVLQSINLKSSDSLANSSKYKDALAALPKNSMTTIYVNGDNISDYLSSISNNFNSPSVDQFANNSVSALALSASIEDAGMRFDIAATYDPTKVNDFQKETLNAKFLNPKADSLAPENTFFFLDVNNTQSPSTLAQGDNPMYTQDVQEALDLFEKQYGVSITKLLELLGGEYALAIGPSNDGPFNTLGEVDLGATLFASTTNEAGANDWFKSGLSAASKEMGMELVTNQITLGGHQLQEVTSQGLDGQLFLYGTVNGYMVIGSSKDLLESGLSGKNTLANNTTYRDTWKAFPSGSVPYLYLNITSLIDFYKNTPGGTFGNAEADLRKIPVIAATMNNNGGYTRAATVIVFINTQK